MTRSQDRHATSRGREGALRLRRELESDRDECQARRIDVFDAIVRIGATLMFRPMQRLIGAYVEAGGAAGIILNTEQPLGMQRVAAAHELGHLVLGHGPHADGEEILRRRPMAGEQSSIQAPPEEREADAFASCFLLPPSLIANLMEIQGWKAEDLERPKIVYQASLRLGAGYAGMVHALERERLIDADLRGRLLKTPLDPLKRRLIGGRTLPNRRRSEVWHLTRNDEGAFIEAGRDDLFLLTLGEATGGGYVWTFDELREAGFVILSDRRDVKPGGQIGAGTVRRVLAHAGRPLAATVRLKERRPWNPEDSPNLVTFRCRTTRSDEAGLFVPGPEDLPAAP